jgi:hypothetical protein
MNQGLFRARMIPLIWSAIWLTAYGAESKADNQVAQKSVAPSGSLGVSGTETRVEVQFRSGKRVAERGLIVKPGERLSFGPTGQPEALVSGFWRSIDAGRYTVSYADPKTDTILVIIELQGNVRWNEKGSVVEGERCFLRIMTEPGIWRKITKREILKTRLVLTDDSGKRHTILRIGPGWNFILAKE